MATDFNVKDDLSPTREILCVDCKGIFFKDAMWSVYAFGEKDDSTTFRGVCQPCRHIEIANPKGWTDNKAINQKRWDKKHDNN